MGLIQRLSQVYARIPLIFLPFMVVVGLASFYVSADSFRNDYVLDRYAALTTGEVVGPPKARGIHIRVDYKFKPDFGKKLVDTRGPFNLIEVYAVDESRSPTTGIYRKIVSRFGSNIPPKGEPIAVEYALHKGRFFHRVYNPAIPFGAISVLFLAIVFLGAAILSLMGKFRQVKD